ncbi:MAG: glycosyltransferase family 1 protein, partial [Kiritimatiellia bacterium]
MARIGINAVALDPHRTGGAETYLRQLIGCPAFRSALGAHDVVLFTGTPSDPVIDSSGFEVVRCPVDPRRRNARILWEQAALPDMLKSRRPDLVHFPYSTTCWRYREPQVVTVHDTANFVMPRSVGLAERVYRRVLQSRYRRNPRCHLIAVSDTDRRIFQRHLTLPDDRVCTVYHGGPAAFSCDEATLGSPRPEGGLLWVGRPYHHKNVDLLVRMMAELARRRPGRVPALRMVGLDEANRARLGRLAADLGVSEHIRLEPARPHHELPGLFRSAQIFVFPSLYESFGLPPLEALCSGTPVVCSDLEILREILGP